MTNHDGVISPQDLQDVCITAATVPSSVFAIPNARQKPLVTIRPDGRLEFGEHYQPDEAAQAFWEAVQRFAPTQMEQQFGKPLAARVDAELAAGRRAQKQVERLDQMATAWKERLPETISRDTVVDAVHQVTREGA
ncbi:hypothetical protein ACFV0T_26350 [Streptomyces sp. NPDC059582]|uniref:hypothetical protein n=1 Tax=Streptomyces sp. NPDC059582 TaxID=3346875 RepID=UPI0036C6FBF3